MFDRIIQTDNEGEHPRNANTKQTVKQRKPHVDPHHHPKPSTYYVTQKKSPSPAESRIKRLSPTKKQFADDPPSARMCNQFISGV